jgi:hypothetical protein
MRVCASVRGLKRMIIPPWSPCAGDALDSPVLKTPNKALSLSLSLSLSLTLSPSLSLPLSLFLCSPLRTQQEHLGPQGYFKSLYGQAHA